MAAVDEVLAQVESKLGNEIFVPISLVKKLGLPLDRAIRQGLIPSIRTSPHVQLVPRTLLLKFIKDSLQRTQE